MDGTKFDALSRRLAGTIDRRRALRGLAAIALGGGATIVAATDGDAANRICRLVGQKCVRNSQCCTSTCDTARTTPRVRRNRCVCPIGSPCGETCVDLMTNFAQCGTCDTACDPERADSCSGGECMCGETPACADGFTCSEGKCLRTPCMPYSLDCLIGVDGTILLHAGPGFQWIGLTYAGGDACATDSDCQGEGCYWPICRCGVERWKDNGETRVEDTGGPGYCVMGSNLPPV